MKNEKLMTIDELKTTLLADEGLKSNPPDVARVIDLLRLHTVANGLINPQSDSETFWNQLLKTWMAVIYELAKRNLHRPAITVVSAFYDRLNELQAIDNKRYHKGAPAMYFGRLYNALGEFQPAAWFFVMTIIEDVISKKTDIQDTLAAKDLRNSFGWNEADIKTIAEGVLELKQPELRHPEIVAVDLLRKGKLNFPPTAKSESEIPINRTLLNQLICDLSNGQSTDEKKKSLEFLASYLAITLPSVKIKANVKTFEQGITFEHEIDLVVIQHTKQPTYLLEALGRHFLIECKNLKDKDGVSVSDLNHFLAKIRFHGCKCGVIFSRNGLTGGKEKDTGLKYARLTQLRWYHQDGCIVIVINEAQLREMVTGSISFAELLLQGYESVKFSIPEGA
jgi:hypothetical protein